MSAGPQDPVVSGALELANRLHDVLVRSQRPDLAARIRTEAEQWGRDEILVVCCGEVKRGKSSLLNALLGEPGLLPVDVDVSTSAQILVRHSEKPQAEVTRWTDAGERARFAVDPAAIENFAAQSGPPECREGVTRVELGVNHPLLKQGVVLVDTPGIGSMTGGHRELARAMLAVADVVLLTFAADQPVLRSELDFLAEAAERSGSIVILLTRIDTVAAPQAAVAEFLARLQRYLASDWTGSDRVRRLVGGAPLAVSARLELRALREREGGRIERADDLAVRSGVGELRSRLSELVVMPRRVRLANLLQLLASLAALAEADLAHRATDVSSAALAEELKQLSAEQEALAPVGTRARSSLAVELQRVQVTAGRALARRLAMIEADYRKRITETKDLAAVVHALPGELELSLQAAWLDVGAAVAGELDRFQLGLASDLGIGPVTFELDSSSADAIEEVVRRYRPDVVAGRFDLVDHGLPGGTQTVIVSNMAAYLLGPVGMVVGAVTVGASILARVTRQASQQTRQQAQQSIAFALRECRQELTAELGIRMVEARTALETAIDDAIGTRRASLAGRRADLDDRARATSAERARARGVVGVLTGELAGVRRDLDELLRRFAAGG